LPLSTGGQFLEGRWNVVERRALNDPSIKTELLDFCGNESNFQTERTTCFLPETVVIFEREPQWGSLGLPTRTFSTVQVGFSRSCAKTRAWGFDWPHAGFGITGEALARLKVLNKRMFAP